MKYFEMSCTLHMHTDIYYRDMHEKLSQFINEAFNDKAELSKKHFENSYKFYSFDLLYNPNIKPDKGKYPKDNSYKFRIRALDSNLLEQLKTRFAEVQNPNFTYITSQTKSVNQFFVQHLDSVTPVIISVENGIYWTFKKDGDILKLQRLIHENLLKKYQSFYGEKLESVQNFIQLLEIKNQKPQTINYKNIRFFGNKFRIIPNEDEVSQKLAFLALACGLGEKNSVGGGFCVGRSNQALQGLVR